MTYRNLLITSLALAASLLVLTANSVCGADAPQSLVSLNLDPTKENPRNSEGSFATLASGRIIFCYSQFYGGAADETSGSHRADSFG